MGRQQQRLHSHVHKQALEPITERRLVKESITLEPMVLHWLQIAARQDERGDRWQSYSSLKKKCASLVGWYASHPDLMDSRHYDAVIEAIDELLPPPVDYLEERQS